MDIEIELICPNSHVVSSLVHPVVDHLYLEIVRQLCQSCISLSFYFDLIITTTPTLMLTALNLYCMLCLSRRAVTYSHFHLLQAASFYLFTYFYHFCQLTSASSSVNHFSPTIFVSLPRLCFLELKLDTGCLLLFKWEVFCLCLSQHLSVPFLICSNVNLFFPMICKVLVKSPQFIFQNVSLPKCFWQVKFPVDVFLY